MSKEYRPPAVLFALDAGIGAKPISRSARSARASPLPRSLSSAIAALLNDRTAVATAAARAKSWPWANPRRKYRNGISSSSQSSDFAADAVGSRKIWFFATVAGVLLSPNDKVSRANTGGKRRFH